MNPVTNYKLPITFTALIILDQITKAIFAHRDFFFGPIKVGLVKNFGLPFGIQSNGKVSSVIVMLIFLFLINYYFQHKNNLTRREQLGFVFIFSGAVSNIIDRLVLGYVRDLFDLHLSFVFNLADVLIIVGVILILLTPLKKIQKEKSA